jgi:rfaE bifunctional protein kinase chain/domain
MHEKIKFEKLKNLINNIGDKTIAVIGDVMIDQYFWGNVSRISPEAPVPVVDIEAETFHLGGAANVAQNLLSLGVTPLLCGLIGNDNYGKQFVEICEKLNIISAGLFKDNSRTTTIKTRIIGNNQQLLRMDKEINKEITKAGENYIFAKLANHKQLDGIIFEDYDKGTLNENFIKRIISWAKIQNIPIFVDPKFKNFTHYGGVTLFKPNKIETEKGLNLKLNDFDKIKAAGKKLIEKYEIENVLITLGADGMLLFEENGEILSIPTIAKKVADVSGAGDTAIASLAALYVSGANLSEAAIIANFASGIVCEKPGIVAIDKAELIQTIERYYKIC